MKRFTDWFLFDNIFGDRFNNSKLKYHHNNKKKKTHEILVTQ